ncbi:MAG: DUF2336 domain-containing protein [Proteobacteria bacterium]|nr:DUF2336 domain-containing protein [Pseudomonadota bacterium]
MDVAVLDAVIDEGGPEARIALARQLAALVASSETPAVEREQVLPVLLKLAVDPERAVREILVEKLSAVESLPADLLFSVIASEDDLALPFLRNTPGLNNWHMMAVLRVGDPARQSVIASRMDLSAEATAFILKSGSIAAVVAVMDNPAIRLSAADLHTIYGRFSNAEEVMERLLALPGLPLDIRILQARRSATRMRQLMAERGWIPANDASELVADAEECAILQVLVDAGDKELAAAVAFMASKQMLTPSLILRAACLGERRVVEATLAHLSGMTAARAAAVIYGRGGGNMKSIVNKAGLPLSCTGVLVAFSEVVFEAREEEVELSSELFGRRLLENLMTRYEGMTAADRSKQIAFVSRLGEEKVRKIARQLRVDIQRAA